jgi:hypothetical protein
MAHSFISKINLSLMAARNWHSLSVCPFVGKAIHEKGFNRPTLMPFTFQPLVVCVWNTDFVHVAVSTHALYRCISLSTETLRLFGITHQTVRSCDEVGFILGGFRFVSPPEITYLELRSCGFPHSLFTHNGITPNNVLVN